MINLARQVDAPSLLPAAFYDLSRYPFSQIFDPAEDDPLYTTTTTSPVRGEPREEVPDRERQLACRVHDRFLGRPTDLLPRVERREERVGIHYNEKLNLKRREEDEKLKVSWRKNRFSWQWHTCLRTASARWVTRK